MNFINQLKNLALSKSYWLFYIFAGLALLAAALYFQYVLDQRPCVVCIQVRMWIALFIIVCFAGLLLRNNKVLNAITHMCIILIAAALIERSYLLLGTERGYIFSDCGFDPGLPTWLALESWFPWLFRVETSCGYTPEIIFGITMAESLMALSILLLISSLSVFLASFFNKAADDKAT